MDDFIYYVATDLVWLRSINTKYLNPDDVGHFWVVIIAHPNGTQWAAQVPNNAGAVEEMGKLVDPTTLAANTTGPFTSGDMISQGFITLDEKGSQIYGTAT